MQMINLNTLMNNFTWIHKKIVVVCQSSFSRPTSSRVWYGQSLVVALAKPLAQGNHKGLPVPYTRRGPTIEMKLDTLVGPDLSWPPPIYRQGAHPYSIQII